MKKIITLGGSNSKTSINKTLAEYTGSLIKGVELIKIDLNDFNLPLFSVDIESEFGIAEAAKELNNIFEKADGFVISLAEHNGTYSAAFKNAFDWLSRINGKVWRNKPMLLLSTSPGERGGQTVLDAALGRFPYMGGNIVGSLAFPSFNDNFINGKIVNSQLKSKLLNLVSDLEKAL
ncbi:NAD(P)H-dependent oxidoreductase [Lutibacter sp.]|uniref:NADPH-dependent FMN reductase n=1 Tax=Lutibacter sp. TaxID=1925666 RepID=UPI0025BAD6F0|nr:NAD(P)H-dependent oxidoreductase [Lutibacter sp.]MCF6180738.1 NAD(P)H-dependent oxidoreductase [Lutibacter sp.]